MRFHPTRLEGAVLIEPECHSDERGFFARVWCADEFHRHGLDPHLVQASVSFNHAAGTLRGLHWQAAPHAETKLVRCTAGAILDVIVDLRPDSPTFRGWQSFELSAANHRLLYIPAGCAHGFITIEPASEVLYQMNEFFHPESARGLRWNDPQLAIDWQFEVRVISARDAALPLLSDMLPPS